MAWPPLLPLPLRQVVSRVVGSMASVVILLLAGACTKESAICARLRPAAGRTVQSCARRRGSCATQRVQAVHSAARCSLH